MTNTLLANVITSTLWTIAIIHVLSDRVVRPFVSAVLVELLPLPIEEEPLVLTAVAPTVSLMTEPTPQPVVTTVIASRKRGRPRKQTVA